MTTYTSYILIALQTVLGVLMMPGESRSSAQLHEDVVGRAVPGQAMEVGAVLHGAGFFVRLPVDHQELALSGALQEDALVLVFC